MKEEQDATLSFNEHAGKEDEFEIEIKGEHLTAEKLNELFADFQKRARNSSNYTLVIMDETGLLEIEFSSNIARRFREEEQ